MKQKAQVLSLISKLELDLSKYHNERQGRKNPNASRRISDTFPLEFFVFPPLWLVLLPTSFYLAITQTGNYREKKLSTDKLAAVATAKTALGQERQTIIQAQEPISDDFLTAKIARLEAIIDNLENTNNTLHGKHNKVHRTYQQNRLIGENRFSAFWKKSFFQSFLSKTIEICQSTISHFKRETGLIEPPAYR